MNTKAPKYPHIRVPLVEYDGNAFAILGRAREAMRLAKLPASEIEAYGKEARGGDYDNLLRVTMKWFNTNEEDDDD